MRRIMLFMAASLLMAAQACSVNVPKDVKDAFAKKFPTVKWEKWSKENDKTLEAEFVLDGKTVSALFSLDGTWMETEEEIAVDVLPQEVKATLEAKFAKMTVKECEKVTKSNSSLTYELEIKTAEGVKEVVFNPQGEILKVEAASAED
ncbi:MAG TPA: PepSY-like domain-containing protein [Williamwhitmania sp.]|nr:PepSY-like domain-containing protein [Williamwhitmania sp.]